MKKTHDKNFWAPGSEIWIEDQLNRTLLLLLKGRFWCYDRITDPLSESMSQSERWWTRSSEMRMWSWEDSAISGMILGEICLEIWGKLRKIHWVIRFFPTVIHGIPMIFKYRLWVSRYPMVSPMFRHTHVAKGQTAVQVRGHGRKRERSGGIQLGIKVTETVIIDAGDSLSSS